MRQHGRPAASQVAMLRFMVMASSCGPISSVTA
jgi:hypothetical protein